MSPFDIYRIDGEFFEAPAREFCAACFRTNPPCGFTPKKDGGVQSRCRDCNRDASDAWYRAHPDVRKQVQRDHHRRKPHLALQRRNARRARELNAACSVHPECERIDLRTMFGNTTYRCQNCQKETPRQGIHIDHKVPLSLGGLHCVFNLQPLCAFCNLSKAAKLPEQTSLFMTNEHPELVARVYGYGGNTDDNN